MRAGKRVLEEFSISNSKSVHVYRPEWASRADTIDNGIFQTQVYFAIRCTVNSLVYNYYLASVIQTMYTFTLLVKGKQIAL